MELLQALAYDVPEILGIAAVIGGEIVLLMAFVFGVYVVWTDYRERRRQ